MPARVLAALAVVVAAGCGGGSTDANADHEQALKSGMGLVGDVHCAGAGCRVTTVQPIATEDEVWFTALPVVAAVDGDPKLADVRTLDLTVMNRKGTREARFDCTFPAERASQSGEITVELVHERCRGTFSGL